ncbi:MAG: hypothetical protein ACTHPS_28895 [Streptosporangiaceae bacterium]
MRVRIEDGGGYQETAYDTDALPRVGETIRIGGWEGEVIKVTHVPFRNASGKRYRDEGDPSALLVLAGEPPGQDRLTPTARAPRWPGWRGSHLFRDTDGRSHLSDETETQARLG